MLNMIRKYSPGRWALVLPVVVLVILSIGGREATAAEVKALVDVNTASQQDLEGLKGVGAATAKKIVENRPYKSVDELSRAGLSVKKIEALKPFVTTGPSGAQKPAPAAASSEKAAAKKTKDQAEPVDLNTADEKTLEALPGIGAKTAQAIIKGRPYKTVDELEKVKGISKSKLKALKGLVTVSEPKASKASAPQAAPAAAAPAAPAKTSQAPKTAAGTEKKAGPSGLAPGEKVNINSASKEKLEALPGIGPAKAQAIIDGRPYQTPEDVMKVKGIKEGTFNKIKDFITVK